jgi:endonuclease/exonuclease/phosphatase family metal-dependent hydrolase
MEGPQDAEAAGRVSRRAVLRAAGTGAAGLAGLTGPASAADPGSVAGGWSARLSREARVATRNLGLGTRLYGFVDTDTRTVDPRQVYESYRQLRNSAPATRMRAIAAGIADELPAVVGLQEVALVRTGPNDYTGESTPNAETVEFDFLELLREGLERELERYDFDAGYEVAVVGENADEEFPAEPPDGEPFDVRLTDRDVVLVRDDLTVRQTAARDYGINVTAPLEDGTLVSVTRGYAVAEVATGGAPFTFVTTHLAVASETVRRLQAAELAGVLGGLGGPVVLAGDLNTTPSGGRSAAYERLVESGLTDAWAATTDDPGPTCCQRPTLRNERPSLGIRVDMVMTRGETTPLATRRVDTDPDDRITATTADGETELWPSDHAGIVADLRVEPTTRSPATLLRSLLFDR